MIRLLEETDVKGLNSLPPIDWRFDYESFLSGFLGEDYFRAFVIIHESKIVGTGNVFFKDKVGWLANIIIDRKQRGKGLGGKMTKFLIDFLKDKGCETQLLIATELGVPVYKKLGFRQITEYQSYETEFENDYIFSNSIRELVTGDLEKVYELDCLVNGECRRHLLEKYFRLGYGYFDTNNELKGCYLPSFGRGLVLSKEVNAGVELLKLKHAKKGSVTLLPLDNKKGIDFFETKGLKKGAKCVRMVLGKENEWNPEFIYSYGSGCFG